jgi:hypothetical protein
MADWDEVWAEYDRRNPAPMPETPLPTPLPPRPTFDAVPGPVARPAMRGRSARTILALVPVLAAAWFSAPYVTAWQLVQAIDGRDHAEMARHVDAPAVQATMRQALEAAQGEGHGADARAFLRAMTAEMTEAWAAPTALAEVARARGIRPGAAGEALRSTMPVGLTRFEMPLGGGVAPMALRIELTGEGLAPRWQVTGVRLEDRAPVPPAPPVRFSGLR